MLLLSALLSAVSPALATEWRQPSQDVLDVLHAAPLPSAWTSPTGAHLLLADPVSYPDLAEYAAGWHELAGIRVKPNGLPHGRTGAVNARIVDVGTGAIAPLALPTDGQVHQVLWTADGTRVALGVVVGGTLELWVADRDGQAARIDGIALNPLLDRPFQWMPDQKRLLVRQIPPDRRPLPPAPPIPAGPTVQEGSGTTARSTYEARNLLKTAHDDALFEHHATVRLAVVDPRAGKVAPLGDPGIYSDVQVSPDGKYVLIERLVGPWSHEVAYWRFAHTLEVWDKKGERVATIAELPLADAVPTHGVPVGPREIAWRPTSPHSLFWTEALDGGNPVAEVPHRDRLMRLDAPFTEAARQVQVFEHRLIDRAWAKDGTLMATEHHRMKRWLYTHLLDVEKGTRRPWFDRNESDRYADPGYPVFQALPNGQWVMQQSGDGVYFSGQGATPGGDRPFLDLRSTRTGAVTRLFRSPADRYESFVDFAGDTEHFVKRTESATDVPNYQLVTLGAAAKTEPGEATRTHTSAPITRFEDPTPQLRALQKRIVTYERDDGVPLSFQLYLPPGYVEGTKLPTVVYAYPLEYSDASTAGQVSGSSQRFDRLAGPSHLYFALQGYAVLHNTAMPMVGDPETVYDTFVPQLVADAEAAVEKAVSMGVADPDRIGVIGHSHGGLMVANLLAHTDLFAAGIARSGSYNKTTQPFGFQSERRTLFEARDTYVQLSPTFFADKVDEPVLVIHGAADSNPGTLTFQSEVFFEAVRGSGGTTRLVLLPFEDHGYRARQSVEHVLWEQLRWFDAYLRGAEVAPD